MQNIVNIRGTVKATVKPAGAGWTILVMQSLLEDDVA